MAQGRVGTVDAAAPRAAGPEETLAVASEGTGTGNHGGMIWGGCGLVGRRRDHRGGWGLLFGVSGVSVWEEAGRSRGGWVAGAERRVEKGRQRLPGLQERADQPCSGCDSRLLPPGWPLRLPKLRDVGCLIISITVT